TTLFRSELLHQSSENPQFEQSRNVAGQYFYQREEQSAHWCRQYRPRGRGIRRDVHRLSWRASVVPAAIVLEVYAVLSAVKRFDQSFGGGAVQCHGNIVN